MLKDQKLKIMTEKMKECNNFLPYLIRGDINDSNE